MRRPYPAATLRGCQVDKFIREHADRSLLDFASGAPLLSPPEAFGIEAARAVVSGIQPYTDPIGMPELRETLGLMLARIGLAVNPKNEITITAGATPGLQAAFLALAGASDEVIVPVPGYEPVFDIIRLAGARPVPVALKSNTWELDIRALRSAITRRTRAIYLNEPGNPTGRIFNRSEIEEIISLCLKHGLFIVEDAVYDEIYFDRRPTVLGTDPRMRDRVVRIGSFSKVYAVPGWRLGFAVARGRVGELIQRITETLTGGAVMPLQKAIVSACPKSMANFELLRTQYRRRRNRLTQILAAAGFEAAVPEGGIYIFARCPAGMHASDLIRHGILAMPGSLFCAKTERLSTFARFCFARPDEYFQLLDAALSRMLCNEFFISERRSNQQRSLPA